MTRDLFETHNKNMIFLVGVPRSGTTWIQSMLAAHPEIGTSQESHLFNQFITPMINQWQSAVAFEDGRGGVGLPAYLTEKEFEDVIQSFIYNCWAKSDDFNQHPFFVEKTPDHLVHIETIAKLIPSAKFIYLKRNPSDVIESLLAAGKDWGKAWAPRNIFKAISLFNDYKNRGEKQLFKLPRDRYHTLTYEALKQNPQQQLSQALDFLNLSYQPDELDNMVNFRPTLRRYGVFSEINGKLVKEPAGFQRKQKEKLSFLQKTLIRLAC